jgi:hypothetical protein
MRLSGQQFKQFQEALIAAFPSYNELARMLRFQLGENLAAIAGSGSLVDVAFAVINWAEAQGRLDELVAQARAANAGNEALRIFAEQFAQAQATAQPQLPHSDQPRPPPRRHRDTYTPLEIKMEVLLERLGKDHERYSDAGNYQTRLDENLAQTRRYGDTELTRAARAEIIDRLNQLALSELGTAFNELEP